MVMHTGFLAAVIAVTVLALAWAYTSRRRSRELRELFGPEYKRILQKHRDAAEAEAVLRERERRETDKRQGQKLA